MSNNQVLGSGEIKVSSADERLQEDRACWGVECDLVANET